MLVTIVGKRGRGKTTLAKKLVMDRVQAETGDLLRTKPLRPDTLPKVPENSQPLRKGRFKLFILDYLGEYSEFYGRDFYLQRFNIESFCRSVWNEAKKLRSSLVVFDEIDLYGKNNPYIDHLYKFGRHLNIDVIAVSRRFYDLPVLVRALTDEFCLFQITEKRDLEYLDTLIEKPFVNQISRLGYFQYLKLSI